MDTHHAILDHGESVRPAALTGAKVVVPVILCGGSGTRLWPLSREGLPKPFWPLVSGQSMLQDTAERAAGVLPDGTRCDRPVVVCNQEHRFLITRQLADANIVDPLLVLEPVGRNSAPAVAAAALVAHRHDPDSILWIMPADAMIADPEALRVALCSTVQAARHGFIATFGMRPTAPETGF